MILAQLIGQVLDEKYRIDKQLGQGGMGAVYLATHLGTKRPVALKVIAPQFMAHAEFVARFQREAEAAGRLRHPNVVNVTDFGFASVDNQRLAYLVMEYLDGCTLGEVLSEESRLPLSFVVDIIEQVCVAVDEAHRQGIIHRDLKPDNIWLEPDGRGGYTIKVLDFGLAKLGDNSTGTVGLQPNAPSDDSAYQVNPSLITAVQMPVSVGAGATAPNAPIGATNFTASAEFNEAATNVQVPISAPGLSTGNGDDEGATAVQMPSKPAPISQLSDDDEGATQVQPADPNTKPADGKATEALTKVGAVLGTPIYMSPEQCAGKPLDPRTDIYSLGVITYEMLAGQPPFQGNMHTLMAKHMTATPQSLKEVRKDIPQKISDLIMATLAKDPTQRPTSAATFASTLRARSEGAGELIRQAIVLYSQHFKTFFYTSVICFLPTLLILFLLGLTGTTSNATFRNPTPSLRLVLAILLTGLYFLSLHFSTLLNYLVTVPIVMHLRTMPLRKVSIKAVFRQVQERWRSVGMLVLHLVGRSFLWFLLCCIGTFVPLFRYFLTYPVFMIEDLKGTAALKRSHELVKRARTTVILIIAIQYAIPFLATTLGQALVGGSIVKDNKPINIGVFAVVSNLVSITPIVLICPLVAILLVLLYFNTRLSGGETINEAALLDDDIPQSRWQQRLHERLLLRSGVAGNTRLKSDGDNKRSGNQGSGKTSNQQ